MKEARGLSIGTLSRLTGVNLETVRYYEKIGIMPTPSRTAAGYRVYSPEHSRRLAFIRRSRQLGFGLSEIRGLLELVDGHAYTCSQVHGMMVGHLSEIDRKIADLRRLRAVMATMAAQCTRNTVPECPVIEALFREPVGTRSRRRFAAIVSTAHARQVTRGGLDSDQASPTRPTRRSRSWNVSRAGRS